MLVNSQPKKILILGPAHPYRGGIATFSERLASEYQSMGHQVRLFTFTLQYPNFLFPGKTQYSNDPAPPHLDIVACINSVNPYNWYKAGKQIAKEQADLIVVQFWLPFMGMCFGSLNHIIKRYSPHSTIVALTHNVIPHEKRLGDYTLTKYFVQSCDGFVSMSKSVLDDLSVFTNNTHKTYSPHPIYDTFGLPVDRTTARKALTHLGIQTTDKLILFFGLVRRYKGLDILLEAMGNEQVKAQGIKLVVAGEFYDDKSLYDDIITKHNLHKTVQVVPEFIATDAVKNYFCAADMVVQPYRTATQSGISQMAYHFECPMLVTKVGGLPEIVPHDKVGYVVPPNNSKAIAEALSNFFSDTEKANFFKKQVAIEKKRFAWEHMANAIIQVAADK